MRGAEWGEGCGVGVRGGGLCFLFSLSTNIVLLVFFKT